MRERYIHYKKAGDQFLGRIVCGLDWMSIEFGVSPCYFDFTGIHEEDRQSTQDSIDKTMKQSKVGGMELAPKVYIIANYFYASLCDHMQFQYIKLAVIKC